MSSSPSNEPQFTASRPSPMNYKRRSRATINEMPVILESLLIGWINLMALGLHRRDISGLLFFFLSRYQLNSHSEKNLIVPHGKGKNN
jgi:hypothetical protein